MIYLSKGGGGPVPIRTIRGSAPAKGHQSGIVYGVQCADNYNCTDCYIGETSQPLRKRLQQHTSGSSVSAVFDHLKASGHKTDLEEVKIIDREIQWFERGVKEAIWARAENPSLNRSGGVRIKLSHAWDRTIRTLPRKLTSSSSSDDVTSVKSPESRSTTSVPSWRVVVPPATSVCSEKRKSSWQDLILSQDKCTCFECRFAFHNPRGFISQYMFCINFPWYWWPICYTLGTVTPEHSF